MLAFLVRRTKNASRFGPPGPKCTRTDFTVTPAVFISLLFSLTTAAVVSSYYISGDLIEICLY